MVPRRSGSARSGPRSSARAGPSSSSSGNSRAPPASTRCRALAVWWSPGAPGSGTRTDGTPRTVISAIDVAPDRQSTRSAAANSVGRSCSYSTALYSTSVGTAVAISPADHPRAPTTWLTTRGPPVQPSTKPATARLIRRAPSEPPKTTRRGRPSSPRLPRPVLLPPASKRIRARTGFPVSSARGRGVPANETAQTRANRPRRRLAAPGTAFCSATRSGTRRATAASPQGMLA